MIISKGKSVLDVVLLVVISAAVIRSATVLRKSKPLFVEFGASQHIVPLIFLFPLGPLALLLLSGLLGLFPAAMLSVACYLPGLIVLKRVRFIFESSGTDRTKAVQDSLAIVFIAGVAGLVYVIAVPVIALAINASAPVQ